MSTLRVATFNTHHCRGNDGRVDIERTAAAIAETGADFIALQELDRYVTRSGNVDQPARLQALTGMNLYFFPTHRMGGGEFGIAIATRERPEIQSRLLRRTPFDRRHGVIVARSGEITFVATHLSRKPHARVLELPGFIARCRRAGDPKLVVGDLNMDGAWLVPLRTAGVGKVPGFRPTFPSEGPTRQPDHILVTAGLRVLDYAAIASAASDHRPLVLTVEV